MILDWPWIYALNVIINSFLGFLTGILFVSILTWLFRIKSQRIKALFFCIPILKVVIDLFQYDFSNWALAYQINPIEAEAGTRTLSLFIQSGVASYIPFVSTGIQFILDGGKTFTLADLIALSIDPIWTKSIVLAIAMFSIFFFSRWLFRLGTSFHKLSKVLKTAIPCTRPIENELIAAALVKQRVNVIVSRFVSVPCACTFYKKSIIFPALLIDKLSQEEFEAIIAHEMGHLNWRDTYVNLFNQAIRHIFWWIPLRGWMMRVAQIQEQACDNRIFIYRLKKDDLASAIVKAVHFLRHHPSSLPVSCFIERTGVAKRVRAILRENVKSKPSKWLWTYHMLVAMFMASLLFGRYWIF